MATWECRVRSAPGLLAPVAAAGRAGSVASASFARSPQCAQQALHRAGVFLRPAAVAKAAPTRRRRRSREVCGGALSVASAAVEADQDLPFTGESLLRRCLMGSQATPPLARSLFRTFGTLAWRRHELTDTAACRRILARAAGCDGSGARGLHHVPEDPSRVRLLRSLSALQACSSRLAVAASWCKRRKGWTPKRTALW